MDKSRESPGGSNNAANAAVTSNIADDVKPLPLTSATTAGSHHHQHHHHQHQQQQQQNQQHHHHHQHLSAPTPQQQQQQRNNGVARIGCGPVQTASAAAATAAASAGITVTASSATTKSAVIANKNPTIVAGTPRQFLLQNLSPALRAQAQAAGAATGGATAVGLLPIINLQHTINLNINTTTGGSFGVTVDPQISVENLKKIIGKKLKVSKDRICLLHRERQLQDGILRDYNLMDGSKIILIPTVETGLLSQRPENTVMQALESLNDSQVNDFLSGKTPLNLSMRLGDHMMLIQLQLSTVIPNNSAAGTTTTNTSGSVAGVNATNAGAGAATGACASSCNVSSRLRSASQRSASTNRLNSNSTTAHQHHNYHADATTINKIDNHISVTTTTTNGNAKSNLNALLSKQHCESLQNIVKSIAMARVARPIHAQLQQAVAAAAAEAVASSAASAGTGAAAASESGGVLEQSPIKSLSNLVSSPIKTTAIKHIPSSSSSNSSCASVSVAGAPSSGISGNSSTSTPQFRKTVAAVAAVPTPATTPHGSVHHGISCPPDPITAKLTSCLCTRLSEATGGNNISVTRLAASTGKSCLDNSCVTRPEVVSKDTNTIQKLSSSSVGGAASSLLHKTANNPITRSKHRHHHFHHHSHHHCHPGSAAATATAAATPTLVRSSKLSTLTRSTSASALTTANNDSGYTSSDSSTTTVNNSATPTITNGNTKNKEPNASTSATAETTEDAASGNNGIVVSDSRTLAEASRNLTQTLRKLSKEVFTNKIDLSAGTETSRKSGSGAVIESMRNHGKGIYSGTFSGTLNPALQDKYGRPKRDISTVIHILNDLLSATPQYSRGSRITCAAAPTVTATAAASSGSSSGSSANGIATITHTTKSKQFSSKHHQHSAGGQSCAKCIKSAMSQHTTSCAYGECNGHYVSKSQHLCKQSACCPSTSAVGGGAHAKSHHRSHGDERNVCNCRYRVVGEAGEREREHTCQKCLVDMENLKTKSKLDQLRLVMQQRKQKREARKLKLTPYGARVVGTAATTSTGSLPGGTTLTATVGSDARSSSSMSPPNTPNEVTANHNIVEEVDTAA